MPGFCGSVSGPVLPRARCDATHTLSGPISLHVVTTFLQSADSLVVFLTHAAVSSPTGPVPGPPPLRFGLPLEAYARAWRISDVATYLGLEKSAAYRLMRDVDAPTRLRTGTRAYRWDGEQVMAWVRGMNWRSVHAAAVESPPTDDPTTAGTVHARATPSNAPPRPALAAPRGSTEPSDLTRSRPASLPVPHVSEDLSGNPEAMAAPRSAEVHDPLSSTTARSARDHVGTVVVDPATLQRRTRASRMAALLAKPDPSPRSDPETMQPQLSPAAATLSKSSKARS